MRPSIASTDPLQPKPDAQPVPGWVASCVLHLILVSFFLSLPATIFAPPTGRVPLTLEASLPNASIDFSSIAVIQPPVERSDHSESVESLEPPSWQQPLAASPSEVASTADVEAEPTDAKDPSQSTDGTRTARSTHGPSRPDGRERDKTPPAWAALAARHVPRRTPQRPLSPRDWPTPVEQKEFDDIVDRFIQFDVGQLRGKEGRRALVEFQALGPESVPSLVRGLNQSASIQYSCPVGVITSKLVQVILQAKDSGLTDYVLRHLGQGVPASAPHYQRLNQLKTYITNQTKQSTQPLQEELRRRNLPTNREMLALIEDLNQASADELRDEVRWGDPVSRLAALFGVLGRAEGFSPEERLQFAGPLVQLLSQRDAVSAGLSHEALVKLADGLDFGGQPKDRDQWIEFWKGMETSLEQSRAHDDERTQPTQDSAPRPAS